MKTSDFDYYLPPELIAQTPIEPRDHSRLMVLHRKHGTIEHHHFSDIDSYFKRGDMLVLNDSRVIPARLRGERQDTGGGIELLLLHPLGQRLWECLAKPARSLTPGTKLVFRDNSANFIPISPSPQAERGLGGEVTTQLQAEIVEAKEKGTRIVRFSDEALLEKLGQVPLPPYIHTPLQNGERYQTVYARNKGSAAAPTAGLHFTPELLNSIKAKGVSIVFTTLHIGLDTFQPVHEIDPSRHQIHKEYGCIIPELAETLNQAKAEGRRIIAVGTTSVRLLEQAAVASNGTGIAPFQGWASLYILPGHPFRAVDALITNFHLPRSTLLMLVSAFAGKELINQAYQEAILERYRFYSFGDAMLVL